MKRLISVITVLLFFVNGTYAEESKGVPIGNQLEKLTHYVMSLGTEKRISDIRNMCPTTKMAYSSADMCLECHIDGGVDGEFVLREQPQDALCDFPYGDMRLLNDGQLYFQVAGVIRDEHATKFMKIDKWLLEHKEVNHVVIESYSPGGSMLAGKVIYGVMDQWKGRGITIETRANGFSASAAFVLISNGTKGHRYVSEFGDYMWHEIQITSFFEKTDTSGVSDKAETFKHLQHSLHRRLADNSDMTVEEIDESVMKKELWLMGRDMIAKGFADGFVSKKVERGVTDEPFCSR